MDVQTRLRLAKKFSPAKVHLHFDELEKAHVEFLQKVSFPVSPDWLLCVYIERATLNLDN